MAKAYRARPRPFETTWSRGVLLRRRGWGRRWPGGCLRCNRSSAAL